MTATKDCTKQRIAVLGLGLIGGSLALRAIAAGYEVVGWDPNSESMGVAQQAGVTPAHDATTAVAGADIVFMCGPLKTLAETARIIASHVAPNAIISDVGSVKGAVRAAIVAAGLGAQYVGAHPMSGTESAGFTAAHPDLLVGATWAVSVAADTDRDRLVSLTRLLTHVFGAKIAFLTDQVHDGAAALISHVPHVLAHALLGLATTSGAPVAQRLAAGSFRDGTRVASLNPGRNQAMIEDNAGAVVAALGDLITDLESLKQSLAADPQDLGAQGIRAGFFGRTTWPELAVSTRKTIGIAGPTWREQLTTLGAAGGLVRAIETADPGMLSLRLA